MTRIFWNQLSILGSTMGTMAEFRAVTRLFELQTIVPVVDHTGSPADARRLWERIEQGEQFGKLVVRWG